MDAQGVTQAQRELGAAYRRRRLIAQLRAKRNAVVEKWAAQAGEPQLDFMRPNGPLDRMWRLTAAIDRAIFRAGGEV
jgi:hypothetical protein